MDPWSTSERIIVSWNNLNILCQLIVLGFAHLFDVSHDVSIRSTTDLPMLLN